MSYFRSDTITFTAALADLKTGNQKARAQAAVALAEVSNPEERDRAVEALIEALASEPLAVRVAVARSLGELGSADALSHLVDLVKATEANLRQVAVISIGRLGLADGFDVLKTAVREGPADVRFQAARSLVELDPDRALDPLLDAIGSEDDDEVIGALALGIAETGVSEAAGALVVHLDNPRGETQFEVAYSLALLGDERGSEILGDALLKNVHAWDAIEALEKVGGEVATEVLAEIVRTNSRKIPAEVVARAAAGLVAISPRHEAAQLARAALVQSLSAWKMHVRAVAVTELARIGGPWALGDLTRLRGRRRGQHLIADIDEAIEAIRSRESGAVRISSVSDDKVEDVSDDSNDSDNGSDDLDG